MEAWAEGNVPLPLQRHHPLLPMFTHTAPAKMYYSNLSAFTSNYTGQYVNTTHSLLQVVKKNKKK